MTDMNLNELTVLELRKVAKEMKVPLGAGISKQGIIDRLTAAMAEQGAPAAAPEAVPSLEEAAEAMPEAEEAVEDKPEESATAPPLRTASFHCGRARFITCMKDSVRLPSWGACCTP